MIEYNCEICGKIFNRNWCLTRHKNRKNPCKNIPPKSGINKHKKSKNNYQNKCSYCNKIFTRKDSLKKHIDNRCKIKKQNAIEKNKLLETLMEQLEDQKIKIEKLEEQIKELVSCKST